MLDYTGKSPDKAVSEVIVNASMLTNNRIVLEDAVFFEKSISAVSRIDGSSVSVAGEVLYVAASGLASERMCCVVYFPDGLKEEVSVSYQSHGLADKLNAQLTAYVAKGTYEAYDYYSVLHGGVKTLPTNVGDSLDPTIQTLLLSLVAFGVSSNDAMGADLTQRLLEYQSIVDAGLDTATKEVDLAVNELNGLVTALVNDFATYQPLIDYTLNTTSQNMVEALNELLGSISGIGPGAVGRMTLGGLVTTNLDVTAAMTNTSKVWLIKANGVQVDGRYADGQTAHTFEAGDTVYYSLSQDKLYYVKVGSGLANKQPVNDPQIPGGVLPDALNAAEEGIAIVSGTGERTLHGYVNADTNLGLSAPVQEALPGYFIVTANDVNVMAEYDDGDSTKLLAGGDVCVYSPATGKFTLKNVNNFVTAKLPFLSLDLNAKDKTIVGAINEAWYAITNVSGVDIVYYDGELTDTATLPGPVTVSSMWMVKAGEGETVAITGLWEGTSEPVVQHLYNGDSVIWNKTTGRLYTDRVGSNTENKQKETDASLAPIGSSVFYEALNILDKQRREMMSDYPGFVGYVFTDTDLTSLATGEDDKWWLVAGNCTITGPSAFNHNATLLERVIYTGGTGNLTVEVPTLEPLQPGFDARLNTKDKSFIGAINELATSAAGGAYRVGDMFASAAVYPPEEAIPLGSSPVSRTEYADLFAVIGEQYGEGLSGVAAEWEVTDSLQAGNTGIRGMCFLEDGDWLVSTDLNATTHSLHNGVTKETIVVANPNGDRIREVVNIPGTAVYYAITITGDVYGYSRIPGNNLSMSPTLVSEGYPFPSVAGLDVSGAWWDGDSSTGTGTLRYQGYVPGSTTSHIVTVLITTFSTGSAATASAGFNFSGYVASGCREMRDGVMYFARWSAQTPEIHSIAAPYTGSPTVIPHGLGMLVFGRMAWSEVDQCFYAAMIDDTSTNPRMLKLASDFSLIEEIDLSILGLTTSHQVENIAIHPATGKLALALSLSGKYSTTEYVSFLIKELNPQETFGIPAPTKGNGVSVLNQVDKITVVNPIPKYYYSTVNYLGCWSGTAIHNGWLYVYRHVQPSGSSGSGIYKDIVRMNLSTGEWIIGTDYQHPKTVVAYGFMASTLVTSDKAYYKSIACTIRPTGSETGTTYFIKQDGSKTTVTNKYCSAYECPDTNDIYLVRCTGSSGTIHYYCEKVAPDGTVTQLWNFAGSDFYLLGTERSFDLMKCIYDAKNDRFLVGGHYYFTQSAGRLFEIKNGKLTLIVESIPQTPYMNFGICQNATSGEVFIFGSGKLNLLTAENALKELDSSVPSGSQEWGDIVMDQDTGNIYAVPGIGVDIYKFDMTLDTTYQQYIKA